LGSGLNTDGYSIAANGSDVYVGGMFNGAGLVPVNYVAHYNSTTGWSAMGSGTDGPVTSLAILGTDVYAGGPFSLAGGTVATGVAKWNGSVWSAVGGGLNGSADALLAVGTDLYAGGSFTNPQGGLAGGVAKWNGSSWTGLGSSISGVIFGVRALAHDARGRLYVGGEFSFAGGIASPYLAQANTNFLADLGVSVGSLSPAFADTTISYAVSVPNAASSIALTPTAFDSTSTIKVNGTTVASGSASGPISLNTGANPIATVVTAQDGVTTRTYTVTVTRALSTNASLSGLQLSSGTLSPSFAPGTTTYSASVASGVTSVLAVPTAADPNAVIRVNGQVVASGTASQSIALAIGPNTITVLVTAQDGTTTATYTVIVTRALSNNADLSALVLSSGTLAPTFAPAVTSYTAGVANAVSSITLTPTAADSGASIKVNAITVASGAASSPIALGPGANGITATVTAADGVTTRSYTVVVTRATASANADLSALSIAGVALTPTFAPGTTAYSASVAYAVASATVSPTAADAGATVRVNGTVVASGGTSGAIALSQGANNVTVAVTAADATTVKTYTVAITRAAATTIPRLANISTRMQVLTGNDVMIGGFVIGGATAKRVAIVATGPSLTAFGITNPLANPTLTLVRSSDQLVMATNDDWQSAANQAALAAAGFAPSNALEAAILIDLPPGAYTAIVSGVSSGTGVSVIGVYEVDHPETPLINISTRGKVLTNNDVMIGGFVIQGSGPQTLAIVATGPSLASFGITSPLANPKITLVRSSDQVVVDSNDDWQSHPNAAQLQSAGFAPSNALEAGIYTTLQPGAYTAIVEGVGGGTGVAVIGVYKVN
jgi:hypothetical protein